MDKIDNRNNWIFGSIKNPLIDKDYLVKHYISQMLNRTIRMFNYNNLPETIPQKDFELQLQVNGFSILTDVNDKPYSFIGGLGGEPNPYYLPTKAVVANPALRFNKTLDIDKDCVVTLNDYLYQGLMPMFNKYANLLADGEITLRYALINSRIPALIEADNDNTYETAVEFIEKVVNGTDYGVISSAEFFDGLRTHDFSKHQFIKDIIEGVQYVKGSWFNEIGLNAAFNMKREAINEAEATLNDDILYPTIDCMLECRQIGLDKYNKMYGRTVTVGLNGVWEKNRVQENLTIEKEKAVIENVRKDTESEDNNEIT